MRIILALAALLALSGCGAVGLAISGAQLVATAIGEATK